MWQEVRVGSTGAPLEILNNVNHKSEAKFRDTQVGSDVNTVALRKGQRRTTCDAGFGSLRLTYVPCLAEASRTESSVA